jgi:hypothetical protein
LVSVLVTGPTCSVIQRMDEFIPVNRGPWQAETSNGM